MSMHFPAGTPEWQVQASDADHSECAATTPNATTCNVWATSTPTPEQVQETTTCLALAGAHQGKGCESARIFAEAHADRSATVAMGTKPWDVWR